MNELPRVGDLDQATEYERSHQTAHRAGIAGIEALEQTLHGETTDAVQISLYVKGRMVSTTTDSATVARILAILTGLGE